jgi:hypothetical protein
MVWEGLQVAKTSNTDRFLASLMDGLESCLPGEGWSAQGSPYWRFVRRAPWGCMGVGPAMSYKHLPVTRVYLNYGVTHDVLDATLRRLTEAAGYEYLDTFHVHQDTQNRPLDPGVSSVGVDDYQRADSSAIMRQLLPPAAGSELESWFDRFSDLREIRRTLEQRDAAISGMGITDMMVAIDVVLGDMGHLLRFKQTCQPRHHADMIEEALAALGLAEPS